MVPSHIGSIFVRRWGLAVNKSLRRLWIAAGYHDKMGSAEVLPPPGGGFRRLYHLTTAEYAISNIVFHRIKVARFSQMNDPFELSASHGSNRPDQEKERKAREGLDEKFGALCFSQNWTDPVLWSHYAARHRGVCLGFDVKQATQVVYTSSRPADGFKNLETVKEVVLRTKFKSWEYEKEWRRLVQLGNATKEGDLHFCPFDDTLRLAEVILGPLCSLNIDALRSAVEKHGPDAVAFRSQLAFNSFNVVPDESTVPSYPHSGT